MSDKTKAEQFLERWFPRSIPKDDFDRHGAFVITWADAEEVMQSYADQEKKAYLKEVLEKELLEFFIFFRDNGEKYIGLTIEDFVSKYLKQTKG